MLKKCKVVMLPTDKKSFIHSFLYNLQLSIKELGKHLLSSTEAYPQHLYIISDDEIKTGDWFFNGEHILQCSQVTDIIIDTEGLWTNIKTAKKIIATTDSSIACVKDILSIQQRKGLTNHYPTEKWILPQPSQQFIEKYVEEYNKGNVIVDVLVEYYQESLGEVFNGHNNNNMWSDLKLKINPKDNTITIKRVKESWGKEDITSLCLKMLEIVGKDEQSELWMRLNYKQWIEENLN